MIVAYVDEHKDRFGVDPICAVLTDSFNGSGQHGVTISPATYYAHRASPISTPAWAEAHLANRLLDLFVANRSVYGARKLWHAARRAGLDVGRDQVARLMGVVGIEGAVRGAHHTRTTRSDRSAPRHPDLIDRAWTTPTRPDQWWVADFTYCWTLAGFCYVAFCTDVYSRRILGWRVTTTKTTPLVTSVLEQALFVRRRGDVTFTSTGLVHHSDAGSQYTSIAFTDALREAKITGSIGSVGDALDNALMESAIGLFKTELVDRLDRAWTGRADLEIATAGWVHWYNTDRLHSALDYRSPAEFEQHYRQHTTATSTPEVA